MPRFDIVVIGAGPAGLACAASARAAGLTAIVLEREATVGAAWRRHYDRLHLHTDKAHSSLPGLPMPRDYPKYPSRTQFIAYLEEYASQFGIDPVLGFEVSSVRRDGTDWEIAGPNGGYTAPAVVIATGLASTPYKPSWPNMEAFSGQRLHSSDYRNPDPFRGQRVLVVGFGNSGGEIALDLTNTSVATTLSVRGPIQILPRDLLGFPILSWAILYQHLPAKLVDKINAPVLRLAVGRVDHLGLTLSPKGARQMVEEDQRVPLIDIGTLARIRDGSIKVRGAIKRFETDGVVFDDDTHEAYDAIILATGYRPDLRGLLPDVANVFDRHGMPLATGRATNEPGLFFCGQITSPTGQLREIAIEAQRIAKLAKALVASRAAA